MIKLAGEMRIEPRREMRGGRGEVRIRHIFEAGEYKGRARLLGHIVLDPGSSIGLHEHKEEEEVFYVLKGRGLFADDGEKRELGPGDAVITGGGGSHSVENDGDEPLELMAVILTY